MQRQNSYVTADVILNHPSSSAGGKVSPLKLIKLVYISHGYHLAFTGEPLLNEEVEAWQYGPVVVGVYDAVRHFRGEPVPPNLFEIYRQDDTPTEKSRSIIKAVADAYGVCSGLKLSSLTHQKETPWDTTYNKKGARAVISNDLIHKYYKTKI